MDDIERIRFLITAGVIALFLFLVFFLSWVIRRYVKRKQIVSATTLNLATIGWVLAAFVFLTITFAFFFLDAYIFFTLPRKIASDTDLSMPWARTIATFLAVPLSLLIRSMFSISSTKRILAHLAFAGLTLAYVGATSYYTRNFYYSDTGAPRKCYARTPVGIVFYEEPCNRVEPRYGTRLKEVGDSGRCGAPVIVAYEWTKGHKKDEDSAKPIRFCERGPNGKLKVYETPFHPVSNEIISPCCPKDLLELELEELRTIREATREIRRVALDSKAPEIAPEKWRQAEQARRDGEAALENKSFQEARVLLEQARNFYEEAKVASASPTRSPDANKPIGRQIEQSPTLWPSVQPPSNVPPVIVHRVQIGVPEIVVHKDGGAGRWAFEIFVDEQRIFSLPPQTYHDHPDKKRVRLNLSIGVTIQSKESFRLGIIGRSLHEGYTAEGNLNILLSSFDTERPLRQTMPVRVLGKNNEGDFDVQLTFVKQ